MGGPLVAEQSRFSFHPLERRGVILGLDAAQLVTMGIGALLGLWLHATLGGAPGALLGLIAAVGATVSALWGRAGRTLIGWAAVAVAWLHRRAGRVDLSDAPVVGTAWDGSRSRAPGRVGENPPAAGGPRRRPLRPGRRPLVAGIEVRDGGDSRLADPHGAIRDRRTGTWTAVVPVAGRAFSLLDGGEQLQQLDAWRTVLAAVARPGSPVLRLQWVRRSGPVGSDPALHDMARPGAEGTGPGGGSAAAAAARRSYLDLVGAATPTASCYDTWLALTVRGERARGSGGVPDSLGRELRFLEGQLRQADLEPGPPLSGVQIHRALGSGALAVREGWSAVQVDADWYATYWVAEWPRVGVGPDFLLPLLIGRGRRAVAVVMAPVAAERAMREVRSARTADLADAELRSRAGFLSSARRDRESDGVTRREQELADGHVEYRFSAYVSVAADGEEGLALACAELEQAAQAARLEVRRLYGRQAEALTWTLPIGRGLRGAR